MEALLKAITALTRLTAIQSKAMAKAATQKSGKVKMALAQRSILRQIARKITQAR